MSDDQENSKYENEEEKFLEFKDEFREKDKIKLREASFGDSPSETEIGRYIIVKDRLSKLLREKKEQQGLVFVMHLKKKNTNIDEEIKQTGDEYSEALLKLRTKTGFSNEEVEEYIEGGREKKIRHYLIGVARETEEELKGKSTIKKNFFLNLKNRNKEKKSSLLISVALIGIPINVPQYGITSIITSGLRSEFLPFEFNPKDKNSLFFLLKTALEERESVAFKAPSKNFKTIDYTTEEEFELRNTRIEMPEPVVEEIPKIIELPKEPEIKKPVEQPKPVVQEAPKAVPQPIVKPKIEEQPKVEPKITEQPKPVEQPKPQPISEQPKIIEQPKPVVQEAPKVTPQPEIKKPIEQPKVESKIIEQPKPQPVVKPKIEEPKEVLVEEFGVSFKEREYKEKPKEKPEEKLEEKPLVVEPEVKPKEEPPKELGAESLQGMLEELLTGEKTKDNKK